MSKKLIGIIASVALVLSLAGASVASALTAADISMLQAAGIISSAQAASLSASIAGTPAVSSTTFAKDLTVGSRGADVTALQNLLGVSPATGYFGALTKAAVIKYQLSKGITPAAGYFGAKTRAVVNGSSSTSSTGGVVVSGTDLSVSLAATSPAASAMIAGQAAADLAEFTFINKSAAPAVVTNITLQRTGVSADTNLQNVYLYSGAVRLTDAAAVSSGKITFNAASGIFTVPAASSITIAVKADIASTANGSLIAVALTGVTASIPVSAVYPVSGASMSVFNATGIAQATSSVDTIGTNITAGAVNQTIWSTSLTQSQRAVYLKSLALKIIGSIPSNSIQNVKLFVAGVQVAQASGMDANSMITFDLTSAPYKIDSGRKFEVRADIVNGSNRTFNVQLQNASDLQLIDSNYNVGITVGGSYPQASGQFSVSKGSVIAQLDSSLADGNIVTGSTNVPLARYTLKAYGEDMKISSLVASSSDQLDNVALYANGVQIGSTQTISSTSTSYTYNVGSSLIIPAGQVVTLEVRGDIKYNGTNATTSGVNTININLLAGSSNAQGSYSSELSPVPATSILSQTMTVVGGGLTAAENSSFITIATPNTSNVRIGSYVLKADSSEAVRVTNLKVNIGGTVSATTTLSNLYTSVNGVSTNPVGLISTGDNNFSVDFTIPANSSTIVDIYADVASVVVGGNSATTTLTATGYGVGSNISLSAARIGTKVLTIGNGALQNATVAGTSPVKQLVVGGSTSKIVDYSFVSNSGDSVITDLSFTTVGDKITAITVGTSTQTVTSGATTTFSGLNIAVPAGRSATTVSVIAQYASVAYPNTGSGSTTSLTLVGFKGKSGNVATTSTAVASSSANMMVVGSRPTITFSPVDTSVSASQGGVILGRIKVSADSSGMVRLVAVPIQITTTATVSVSNLQVQNGSDYTSIALSGTSVATGTVATINLSGFTTNAIGEIAAGQTKTFDIIGDVLNTSSTVNGNIQTKIASSTSGFTWEDVVGGNATLNGAYILNFPTNQATVGVSY